MSAEPFVIYKGQKYHLQSTGRYYQSGRKTDQERLLHRRVWSDNHGPIPENHDVHHKDDDWTNNHISNLEALPSSDHKRMHMKRRMSCPKVRERAISALDENRDKAAEWHASDEGIEWHRAHGKAVWEVMETKEATCERCGSTYQTYYPGRSKFCSRSCEQKGCYDRQRTEVRTCVECGDDYMANKYRNTVCCSKACSNKKRGREQRQARAATGIDDLVCVYCSAPFKANKGRQTECCSRRCGTRLLAARARGETFPVGPQHQR